MQKSTNRVSITEASEILDLPKQTLRVFLQNGLFKEFGLATKLKKSSQWTYYISRPRLEKYILKNKIEPIKTAI
ncbi:MAG: hypothetical protein KGV57_02625 [Fusobacterium sp.]|nr:hypothetical protein [Fusobacterium sp.]